MGGIVMLSRHLLLHGLAGVEMEKRIIVAAPEAWMLVVVAVHVKALGARSTMLTCAARLVEFQGFVWNYRRGTYLGTIAGSACISWGRR